MSMPVRLGLPCLMFAIALGQGRHASAVIIAGGTLGRNTEAPTGAFQDSGWQYEGAWQVGVGTPIDSKWFLTAKHLGGSVGDSFVVHGVTYTTSAVVDDPSGSDLRLWQIAQSFQSYAPLYAKSDEVTGQPVVSIFGRGTARGAAIDGPNGPQGYAWGGSDGQLSWGANRLAFVTTDPGGPAGDFLAGVFSATPPAGVPASATLSAGDSGGGVFIRDSDGIWKLAAVNYGVDGGYSLLPGSGYFNAALYDTRDYYVGDPANHTLVTHPNPDGQVPQAWYSSRVSTRLGFIEGVTGVPEPGSLALVLAGLAMLGVASIRQARRSRLYNPSSSSR